jgi:SAM-dependent methyltransferase
MRFALPWRTRAAVLSAGAEELPQLGGSRETIALPAQPAQSLADRLRALRDEGCEYLLVPAAARLPDEAWVLLRSASTLVSQDAGGFAVLSLHPAPEITAPDGLPVPPAHLIRLTSGCLRQAVNRPDRLYESYLERGAEGAACIRRALDRHGLRIEQFDRILDFGCGCGRVTRHWHDLSAEAHGCDYNPLLVEWCAAALGFGEFRLNPLGPALPYEDGEFEFLYAISLFTHFDADQQLPWIRELARVVRPGGVLLVTVSGEARAAHHLQGARLERFRSGELVVTQAEMAGTNACAAFHPRRYVEETFSAGLELIGLIPDGAADVRQDQVLLRKPAGRG